MGGNESNADWTGGRAGRGCSGSVLCSRKEGEGKNSSSSGRETSSQDLSRDTRRKITRFYINSKRLCG